MDDFINCGAYFLTMNGLAITENPRTADAVFCIRQF